MTTGSLCGGWLPLECSLPVSCAGVSVCVCVCVCVFTSCGDVYVCLYVLCVEYF